MSEKIYVGNGNIMYIYNVMKKYTDVDHPLKVNEIIELIKKEYGEEISSRTIRRDFKVLEEKFSISIEKINDAYYIDYADNDFDSSEIRCIVDMVNYSRFVDEATANSLTYKLINMLNENDKKEFIGYEKYMNDTKTINKQVFYSVKTIAEAISNKKYIDFDYYKYNLKKEYEFRKSFHIFPLTIICGIGQYYLIATDINKKLLYFRLDRIKNISITEGKPINISKKQLNDYIHSTIGMYGGEKEIVQALVSNNLIDDVIDNFGTDAEITPYDNEFFTLKAEANLEGFKYWALRRMDNVKVIYPEKLKDEIIQILEKSIKKYKEGMNYVKRCK